MSLILSKNLKNIYQIQEHLMVAMVCILVKAKKALVILNFSVNGLQKNITTNTLSGEPKVVLWGKLQINILKANRFGDSSISYLIIKPSHSNT